MKQTKRTLQDPGQKASSKKTKSSTEEQSPKFDKDAVDSSGFCSNPSLALSTEQIELVTGDGGDATVLLTEKDLVGKGKKFLHKIDGRLCFYYDGKKFVKKDRLRIEAMIEAARRLDGNEEATAYVLLAAESGICKRNTLPELCGAGFVVQRV